MENLTENSPEMETPKESEIPMETSSETPKENSAEKLLYAGDLKTGDFVENASRIKYAVTLIDGFVHLDELDAKGEKVLNAKKRRMPLKLMDGLIKTKHFTPVKFARRIHHGEVEANLELNKLLPK